jgi:hypothetical protein
MKKPLKVAAWSGLISLIVSMLSIPFVFLVKDLALRTSISIFISILGFIFGFLFLNGFLTLGKKFKNTLLVVMAWIGIAFAILMLLFSLVFGIVSLATNVNAQELKSDSADTQFSNEDIALGFLFIFLLIWIPLSLFMGAYSILFGIGILKLKDKIQYAKPAGILNIVAGATYIILIGLLVRVVAYIFEIMMFFNASKKLER